MTRKHLELWLLLLVLLAVPACKSRKADIDQTSGVVATVNGVAITEDDLYLRTGGDHAGSVTPAMRSRIIDGLVNQELLYQDGMKLGLDKDPKYRNAVRVLEVKLRDFKRSEMSRRVGSTRIAATVNVTNADVDRYIKTNADLLRTEFHLGMMRFPDEAEAKEARDRIRSGESFEKVAGQKRTHGPKTGRAPWDLGYRPWNQLPAEWRDAAERLEKGAVSDVLYGKGTGYSLIKLIDRKKNLKLDLRTMNAAVMNRLRDEKITEAYEQYVQKLRQEATIKRFDERRE